MDDEYFDQEIREKAARLLATRKEQEERANLQAAIRRFTEAQAQGMQTAVEADQHAEEVAEASSALQAAFIEAAVIWLEKQWGPQRRCPYCESNNWSVGTPFEVSLESGEALSPHFPVMCDNCGNTVFVNAIVAGLLPEPEE
jgi:hypothetical protein